MTRKTQDKRPTPKADVKAEAANGKRVWGGFHPCAISEQDKVEFRLWMSQYSDDVWQHLDECVNEGLKLSFKADKANNCVIASLTGGGKDSYQDTDICLTARGADMGSSAALLAYKFVVMLQGDLSTNYNSITRGFGSEI